MDEVNYPTKETLKTIDQRIRDLTFCLRCCRGANKIRVKQYIKNAQEQRKRCFNKLKDRVDIK